MKVIRIICVDCGLGRRPFVPACPRCESSIGVSAKVEADQGQTVQYDPQIATLAYLLKEVK